jgi:tRNA-dihydrouridine synthase
MLEEAGCMGVMIGRGALANPWVFHEIYAGLTGASTPPAPTLLERVAFMTRHFLQAVALLGERIACLQFRKMIDWYAKSFGPCGALRKEMKELRCTAHYHDLVGRFLAERSLSINVGEQETRIAL